MNKRCVQHTSCCTELWEVIGSHRQQQMRCICRQLGLSLTQLGSPHNVFLIAHHSKDIMHARVQAFDVVIDATGSSQGILLALAMVRCMGTAVLKSTCSLKDPEQPQWSAIANDLVVNEKRLVGSRYGCTLLLLLVKTGNGACFFGVHLLCFVCLSPVCFILEAEMLNFQCAALLAFEVHQKVFVARCSIMPFVR